MQKVRIIYFQQNIAIGATEEYFYLLMEGIDQEKFDVTFVCPESVILDSLATRIEGLGIKVYRYRCSSNNYLYLQYFFRKLKPDIVHFNDPCIVGIIAARLASAPILLMTHHTPKLNRRYNLKGRLLERIALKYCGIHAIVTSEYDRETGIKKDKIPRGRTIVIYYGLPPQKFQPKYDRKEVCREFSLNEDCRMIGNIARLNIQKGQRYLIEAASMVIEKFKSVKFFLVGEGELELELKAQIQQNGLEDYFIFTGYRTDVPRLLSAFEVLVMPSLFEGLCFAVIEASAMAVPVIATAVGVMQRSVINGRTGLLVPPKDTQALANAILWMLGHPDKARQMGSSGRRYFEELFTQNRMVKKTEDLYESLLLKRKT